MSVRVIFVRHGETDWNKDRKLQGSSNTDLNETGIEQIREVAEKIENSNEKPEIIISSPLRRAKKSAAILSYGLVIPWTIDKNLIERDFGDLEGKTREEAKKFYSKDFKAIDREYKYDYSAYGGDSAEDVIKRIRNFIKYIKKEYKGKTIIVVTHAGVLRHLSIMFPRLEIGAKQGEYYIVEIGG